VKRSVSRRQGPKVLERGSVTSRSPTGRIVVGCRTAVAAAIAAVPGVSHVRAHLSPQGPTTTAYYLSLGDSYSVGYRPLPTSAPTPGYTAVVATKLKLTLENFGCAGTTTASILSFDENYSGVTDASNNPSGYGPAAVPGMIGPLAPGQTQVQAADAFIAAHPGSVGLVTVSIGGNDVTSCAGASISNPVDGKTDALPCVQFPASAANQTLAGLSLAAFGLMNPALKDVYTAVPGGRFADVTTLTKAYIPFKKQSLAPSSVTDVPPGTNIAKAVAAVCNLTWFCQLGDIHANTTGYNDIGKLVVKTAKH